MDMHVNPTRGNNLALAGDHLRAWSNDYADVWLHVRITRFTDCCDVPVLDRDIGFHNAPVVQNKSVGDHSVDGAQATRTLRLAHAIANNLSPSELHLFAIDCEVILHLDYEIRICKAHLVTYRRTKHLCIGVARHSVRHLRYLCGNAPITACSKP